MMIEFQIYRFLGDKLHCNYTMIIQVALHNRREQIVA